MVVGNKIELGIIMPVPDIKQPTLLLDSDRARRNLQRMVTKAGTNDVLFRPHFKTHQSQEIGRWFRDSGVTAITVSSLAMAEYFARDDWKDITVAMPVNLREIDRINRLAENIDLHLLVDSPEAVDFLADHLLWPVAVWIKIDVGYHRCGQLWYNTTEIIELAQKIVAGANMNFRGILTHAGHTYQQPGPEEVLRIHEEAVRRLIDLRGDLRQAGIDHCAISIGDTPGCSLADNFAGVDEIRPGNFIFNDLMQWRLGVCSAADVAVAVVCPVIGKYPKRNEIVIHCGAVHLSKEGLKTDTVATVFGYLAPVSENGWGPPHKTAPVIALSQEHGIVQLPPEMMTHVTIGSLVTILPVHSCLTANLYSEYLTLDGQPINKMQSLL
ncbi:MAG: alanine racemase [Candidatus Neomarinimicrobiota bacterium]